MCVRYNVTREIERDRERKRKKTDDEKIPSMLEERSITFYMAN